jgi:hypothetical protein
MMASPCDQRRSIFILFAFFSINSTVSLLTASNSNPISSIHRQVGVSPAPFFCRHGRKRHRRHELELGLESPTHVDSSYSKDPHRRQSPRIISILYSYYMRYLDLCQRRPFLTSSITAGLLAATGDALSQSLQAGHAVAATTAVSSFNWIRCRTFLLTGLLFEGPWVCFWYQGLWKIGRWMERNFQSGPRLQVLAQVVTDQTIGVAIFFPLYFAVYEVVGASVSGQGKTVCRCIGLLYSCLF